MKQCKKCCKEKEDDLFYNKSSLSEAVKRKDSTCKSCRADIQRERRKSNPQIYIKDNQRNRDSRASGLHRCKWMLQDIRKRDKEKGLKCDVDREYVESMLESSCLYCGSDRFIGLDRVDNSLGHTRDNTVASCRPCNILRRDVPFAAWLVIVPAVRKAKEAGLLDEWYSRNERFWAKA